MDEMKNVIDNKIKRINFIAKNFTIEDIKKVNLFCDGHFGNDRRKMILTLITLFQDDAKYSALNDKVDLIAFQLNDKINEIIKFNDNIKIKQSSWKGFNNGTDE